MNFSSRFYLPEIEPLPLFHFLSYLPTDWGGKFPASTKSNQTASFPWCCRYGLRRWILWKRLGKIYSSIKSQPPCQLFFFSSSKSQSPLKTAQFLEDKLPSISHSQTGSWRPEAENFTNLSPFQWLAFGPVGTLHERGFNFSFWGDVQFLWSNWRLKLSSKWWWPYFLFHHGWLQLCWWDSRWWWRTSPSFRGWGRFWFRHRGRFWIFPFWRWFFWAWKCFWYLCRIPGYHSWHFSFRMTYLWRTGFWTAFFLFSLKFEI